MPRKDFLTDSGDRARSAAATAAIHLALGAAFLAGLTLQPERRSEDSLKTFDVIPPPPPIEPTSGPAPSDVPAPAGRKADPSPIVAPPARLPSPQPVVAAPIAGSGASANAGAAASGSGTGAGGSGTGGGGGGVGGGIGTEARLLSGNRARVPRQLLRALAADHGYAHLLLTIGETGRVAGCGVIQGTGSAAVDQALCQVMIGQSRWSPARDTAGRPISVQLRYTSTWSK